MWAVIEIGGKQYKVSAKDKIRADIVAEVGQKLIFDRVLLKSDAEGKELKIGQPYVEGSRVEADVLKVGREKKKIVFRYHSKTRYRKLKGHRQPFVDLEISKIE